MEGTCPRCGGERYEGNRWGRDGLCPGCRRREKKKEEDAMRLQEMAVAYRTQENVLKGRLRELRDLRAQAEDSVEKEKLKVRIDLLTPIWRETRDLAVLLERYYERGYRRNGKYTL